MPGAADPPQPPIDVLIVAEPKATREMMREILESTGFRVTEARSAKEAVSAVRSIPFDVILTEVEGDDDDVGVWLLRRLHAWGEASPVIALTDHRELEHELGRLGFAAVLVRPVDAADLIAVVRRVVERHRDDDLR